MSDASSRWWEQYYVRYFVGTVIGVIAIFVLRENAALGGEIGTFIPPAKDINAGALTAVAFAGLAYCYVASAPVLALHGVRGDWLNLGDDTRFWVLMGGAYVVLVLGLVLVACLSDEKLTPAAAIWIGRGVLAAYLMAQFVFIGRAMANRFTRLTDFYVKLATQRSRSGNEGGYLDSYKHLREHGNAVMIVVNEISLGLILSAATSVTQLVSFVLLWILPATSMWFVGTHLERHLSRGQSGLRPA